MTLTLKTKNMRPNNHLRKYVSTKIHKPLQKIVPNGHSRILVELNNHKNYTKPEFECRVVIDLKGGKTLTVSETNMNIEGAINLAHDTMLMQVKRATEKQKKVSSRAKKYGRLFRTQPFEQFQNAS